MLDVTGDVEIEFGSGRGRLVARGGAIVLDVDSPGVLTGVIDRQSLTKAADLLARDGLALHVRSGERLVLSAGRGVTTGILARLLRLPGVQLSPSFAARSALGWVKPRPRGAGSRRST